MTDTVNVPRERDLARKLRSEAVRMGRGIPSDVGGFHKVLWSAAELLDQAADTIEFNARALLAFAPKAEPVNEIKSDIAYDRSYLNGLRDGWKMGQMDEHEKYERIVNARIAQITEANAALRAQPEAPKVEQVPYCYVEKCDFLGLKSGQYPHICAYPRKSLIAGRGPQVPLYTHPDPKLSIAMVALQKITGDIYDEEEASEETIAYRALAQIKGPQS